MEFVLAGVAVVQGEVLGHPFAGAAEKGTEVLVQVGQESAVRAMSANDFSFQGVLLLEDTDCWFEFVPLAGMFINSGAAPPSSKKFCATPLEPPALVEARPPSKYGSRLTSVPLYVPAARIPGTLMPTLGWV